jgi:polyisoprenoid-binding protein YceI
MTKTSYQIDTTHSSVEFSIRHLVIAKVRGRFARFGGTIELDESDVTLSTVKAEIEAASISTSEEKRDAHLRSPDFFDVENFPLITFASSKIEQKGDDLKVTGALTIHGVTRDVVLAVESLGAARDPWGNQRVAFTAKGSIDRKEFGLHWNQVLEAGGFLVGDKVELSLDVQAVRASAQAAA